MTGPLAGRTALVLGANGGIGRAIAHALWARLILPARDTQRLERLAAELDASCIRQGTEDLRSAWASGCSWNARSIRDRHKAYEQTRIAPDRDHLARSRRPCCQPLAARPRVSR